MLHKDLLFMSFENLSSLFSFSLFILFIYLFLNRKALLSNWLLSF